MRTRARGSVLLLMPAALFVVLVLGSIAVDFTVVFLGEREAASLAAAAANDAATAALDQAAFRERGELRIDRDVAVRVAREAVAASSTEIRDVAVVAIEVADLGGDPAVTVTVGGEVAYIFAKALPGAPDRAHVEATATAVASRG